jgi:urease subunit alpha
MADLVLWKPKFFGAKPEMVLKGGLIAYAAIGDPNASIPTPQPVFGRYMFGALGRAKYSAAITFVSRAAFAQGIAARLGLRKMVVPVAGCRNISKKDMLYNDLTPKIEVDPETYEVKVDGQILTCAPARQLPLTQRYFLF